MGMTSDAAIKFRGLADQFNATLTPQQRQLLLVGALKDEHLSGGQLEILKAMKATNYLNPNLTVEQARQFGAVDLIEEYREKGESAGDALALKFKIMAGAVGLLIVLLILLRC
jgi:hypothetical protein